MKVEIPAHLIEKLGPEMQMDVHWIDVKLKNGQIYRGLVVRGDKYITGFKFDPNGEGDVPFTTSDIQDVSRESLLLYLLAKSFGLFGKTRGGNGGRF